MMAKRTPGERAKALEEQAKKRAADRAGSDAVSAPQPKRRAIKGKPRTKIRHTAQQKLESLAKGSMVEQFDLFPGKEWPTPFCRIPLFPPVQRRKARAAQQQALEHNDFVPLVSKWDGGGIWRSGPALTVFDEDTLLALVRLRRVGLKGPRARMPDRALEGRKNLIAPDGEHDVTVHATYCLVSDVETEARGEPMPAKGWGGDALQRRRESIERLGAQILMFESPHGRDEYRGKQIRLLSLDWIGDDSEACYYIQFHPLMVSWLEQYRTYLDPKIRRKLTPLGRALYRLLASQRSNRTYSDTLSEIAGAIGYERDLRFLKRDAITVLEKLVSLEFLSSFEIKGTGRATPYRMNVVFKYKE